VVEEESKSQGKQQRDEKLERSRPVRRSSADDFDEDAISPSNHLKMKETQSFKSSENKGQRNFNNSLGTRSDGRTASDFFDLTVDINDPITDPIMPEPLAQYEDFARNTVEEVFVNEILESINKCF
jgi:hypothetical protein